MWVVHKSNWLAWWWIILHKQMEEIHHAALLSVVFGFRVTDLFQLCNKPMLLVCSFNSVLIFQHI